MSDVSYFADDQPINPFMSKEVPINRTIAQQEHTSLKQAFESAGMTVTQVAAPRDCQDGVFTANWALVRGDTAVLARLPNARQAEEAYAKRTLEQLGKTVHQLPEGLLFSGQGDALACGNLLFCGSGYRSDKKAQQLAADLLGFQCIQLQTVPQLDDDGTPVINAYSGLADSFYYDIDLALAILKHPVYNNHGEITTPGLVAWCPRAFIPESQQRIRSLVGVTLIEVSESEAVQHFACNLVSTGTTVIVNAGATQFARDIKAHGLNVITLNNPELAKGGGSMRCCSLTLD